MNFYTNCFIILTPLHLNRKKQNEQIIYHLNVNFLNEVTIRTGPYPYAYNAKKKRAKKIS